MRVGVSGAHGTGKTTLVEELCAHLAGHLPVDEPYFVLEVEPSADDRDRRRPSGPGIWSLGMSAWRKIR
jgi:uridine kinase